MKLTLKTGAATILWTAAVACAISFSIDHDEVTLIWGLLDTAVAVVVTSMVACDYIARDTAHYIVDHIKAERDATVDRATKAMQEAGKQREDRIVSRVQSTNEAAIKRVAVEVAEAIMQESATPFRRN